MLSEISCNSFYANFPDEPHFFLKKSFIDINSYKVEKIVFLVQNIVKPSIGLIAGIKDGTLMSPFSAPFGGFHYRHEKIYISELERFVDDLKAYIKKSNYNQFYIVFPPSIYGVSFNSKMINTLIRKQVIMEIPDLTNWISLSEFEFRFKHLKSRNYYNQALRNKLVFSELTSSNDKKLAFDLISSNRKRYNRTIYMTYDDLMHTAELWPIDFFGIYDTLNNLIAAGIFYQFSGGIVYTAFWGDNEKGRPLRAMDFLSFNVWSHYKKNEFLYIDFGISTEQKGEPNEGLIRFKETHEAVTELRYKLKWECNG